MERLRTAILVTRDGARHEVALTKEEIASEVLVRVTNFGTTVRVFAFVSTTPPSPPVFEERQVSYLMFSAPGEPTPHAPGVG